MEAVYPKDSNTTVFMIMLKKTKAPLCEASCLTLTINDYFPKSSKSTLL